jgi:hypothetical protein
MYTSKIDGRRYVGVTKRTVAARANGGKNYRGSPYFYAAIQKHGFDSFSVETMAEGLTKEAAATLERELISRFKTMSNEHGFNLHRGGFENCGDDVHTREDRVARIKAKLRAQRSTPEERGKMRDRMLKVWADPATRANIIAKRSGKLAGRKATSVRLENTGEVFPSLRHAGRGCGINFGVLHHALKKSKTGRAVVIGPTGEQLRFVRASQTIVDVKHGELLENPERPVDYSVIGDDGRECEKQRVLGNQQPRPCEPGQGSETIPSGSRAERPEAPCDYVSEFGL